MRTRRRDSRGGDGAQARQQLVAGFALDDPVADAVQILPGRQASQMVRQSIRRARAELQRRLAPDALVCTAQLAAPAQGPTRALRRAVLPNAPVGWLASPAPPAPVPQTTGRPLRLPSRPPTAPSPRRAAPAGTPAAPAPESAAPPPTGAAKARPALRCSRAAAAPSPPPGCSPANPAPNPRRRQRAGGCRVCDV